MAGSGGHVQDDGSAEEEPDHAEVGGAGGEGLPVALSGLDPQDGGQDEIGRAHV